MRLRGRGGTGAGTHLDDHVHVAQAAEAVLWRHDAHAVAGVLRVGGLEAALCDVLGEELVHEGEALVELVGGAVVEEDGDLGAEGGDEGDAGACGGA